MQLTCSQRVANVLRLFLVVQQTQASAGYFEFNAGTELGVGSVGRYLCLDLGADRQQTQSDASDGHSGAHERGGGGGGGGGGGILNDRDTPTVRQKSAGYWK